MKLIIRADDLGFSEAVNYGIRKSVCDGVVRNVGLMPNMDAAKHGVELIKSLDIALGQHTNICIGKPVADPSLISSLINETGEFCSSKEIKQRAKDTIVLEEAIIEVEAQLHRFEIMTGKLPDYIEGHAVNSNKFMQAIAIVAKRHHLFLCDPMDATWRKQTGITCGDMYHLDEQGLYDPYAYIFENQANIQEDIITILVYHPGFLDQYILEHSSYTLIRPLECEFLCSKEYKNWIKQHQVELLDFRMFRGDHFD